MHWLTSTPAFLAFSNTSADKAANFIIDCGATLVVPNVLMSYGPTHSNNETISQFSKGFNSTPLHVALLSSVKRECGYLSKERITVFREILSKLQLRPEHWSGILPILLRAFKNAPSPPRQDKSPVTMFLGVDPTPPILIFLRTATATLICISNLQAERTFNVYPNKRLSLTFTLSFRIIRKIIEENLNNLPPGASSLTFTLLNMFCQPKKIF